MLFMKNFWIGILLTMLITSPLLAQYEQGFRKHYVNHTEFGVLLGRVTYGEQQFEVTESKTNITAQTFNGIQLKENLAVGLTVGTDWYKGALVTPAALGVRYQFGKHPKGRFFALLDSGYGLTWFHKDNDGFESSGGWMVNPGIGMGLGKKKGLTFSVSWKRQHLFVEKPILGNQIDRFEDRNFQRIVFRIGMAF